MDWRVWYREAYYTLWWFSCKPRSAGTQFTSLESQLFQMMLVTIFPPVTFLAYSFSLSIYILRWWHFLGFFCCWSRYHCRRWLGNCVVVAVSRNFSCRKKDFATRWWKCWRTLSTPTSCLHSLVRSTLARSSITSSTVTFIIIVGRVHTDTSQSTGFSALVSKSCTTEWATKNRPLYYSV